MIHATNNAQIQEILKGNIFLPGDLLFYSKKRYDEYDRIALIMDCGMAVPGKRIAVRDLIDVFCTYHRILVVRKVECSIHELMSLRSELIHWMLLDHPKQTRELGSKWARYCDYYLSEFLGREVCWFRWKKKYSLYTWGIADAYRKVLRYVFISQIPSVTDMLHTVLYADFDNWEPVACVGPLFIG